MDQRTVLEFRKDDVRAERRMKILPTLMIAAIFGLVVLALVAQARLASEQRIELSEPHPFL